MDQADATGNASSQKVNGRGEWLPIETAPKDGTKIDLLYPYPRGRAIDCYWGESELTLPSVWVFRTPTWGAGGLLPENEWNIHVFANMEPTHWMPCPAFPDGWLNFSNEAGSDADRLNQPSPIEGE